MRKKLKIDKVWGVKIINTTPHEIRFTREDDPKKNYFSQPCGVLLNAKPVEEKVVSFKNLELVKTRFLPTPEGLEFLKQVPDDVVVVGSALAAQAYPGKVKMLVPCKGYERVLIDAKRMRHDKFTVY